ncbi:hypothetical protein B0H17DRAFT_1135756 [Mycena rosella]|uniref:Uncharacterized protein n=1 Tax=Mycena rosella TaxID=1033263 RepID=A0AAD7DCX8_MYCRO|nr:hypothetical protein B0H17DRAFT_1135756 [Mycena rosella]
MTFHMLSKIITHRSMDFFGISSETSCCSSKAPDYTRRPHRCQRGVFRKVSAVSAEYGDHFPRGHVFAPTTAANGADNLELHAGTRNRQTTGAAPPSPLVSPSPHTNFLDHIVPTFTRLHHHKFPILNCIVALKDRIAVETQDPCGGCARRAMFFLNLDPTLYGNCIHTSLSMSLGGAPPSRSCRASTLYKVGVRELRVDSGVASTAKGEAAEGPRAKWDNRTAVATLFRRSSLGMRSSTRSSASLDPLKSVFGVVTPTRAPVLATHFFSRINEAAHIPARLVADTLKELKIEIENIGKYRPINGYRHTATGNKLVQDAGWRAPEKTTETKQEKRRGIRVDVGETRRNSETISERSTLLSVSKNPDSPAERRMSPLARSDSGRQSTPCLAKSARRRDVKVSKILFAKIKHRPKQVTSEKIELKTSAERGNFGSNVRTESTKQALISMTSWAE